MDAMASTLPDIRRANLAAVVKRAGGTASFARTLGVSDSQVTQWMHGSKDSKTGKPRGMSHDTCRRIERAALKPEGWMDIEHQADDVAAGQAHTSDPAAAAWPLERIPPDQWAELTERERGAIEEAAMAKLKELQAEKLRRAAPEPSAPAGDPPRKPQRLTA